MARPFLMSHSLLFSKRFAFFINLIFPLAKHIGRQSHLANLPTLQKEIAAHE